jgi:hypothetical protein
VLRERLHQATIEPLLGGCEQCALGFERPGLLKSCSAAASLTQGGRESRENEKDGKKPEELRVHVNLCGRLCDARRMYVGTFGRLRT